MHLLRKLIVVNWVEALFKKAMVMHCIVFVHIYPPFTRKRIVLLYFGRNVRTRLGVAIFEVSGPPVFHIKAGACSLQPPINAERQAGKLWIPFFKVFWYDSTRGMNP